MLTLTTGLSRELKIARLAKVRQAFSLYFGFTTNESIITALNYANATSPSNTYANATSPSNTLAPMSELTPTSAGNRDNLQHRFGIGRGTQTARDITSIFLEGDGMALTAIDSDQAAAPKSKSIADQLKNIASPTSRQLTPVDIDKINIIKRFVTVFFSIGHTNFNFNDNLTDIFHASLDRIGFNTTASPNPSSTDEQESKLRLSAFLMRHPILVPSEKNADLLSVFFNAMPAIELTRATPVMNVRIFSKKQVFQSDDNGRLSAVSLPKFLEGAINTAEGGAVGGQYSVLRALALANQVTSSMPIVGTGAVPDTGKDFQFYSISGMELFQSPQTLVNPDAAKIRNNFLASPIDPFRPLATIKSFDVDVKSTGYGLISTKQSKLEIILHDRSRMGEFADIVKPDRFGNSFVEVEYGWSHPDQLSLDQPNTMANPYADLLNLTRSIDHYSVVNSSFSFDEVGQVTITLNLISRGVSEMAELSITGEQNELRAQLEHIRVIAETITQLTAQVYRPPSAAAAAEGGDTHREEVRGHQMLGAAGDATNFLVLSPELIASYRQLITALGERIGDGAHRNAAAVNLKTNLENLVGRDSDNAVLNTTTGGRENGGLLGNVRRTVNNSIKASLDLMNHGLGSATATSRDTFFEFLDDNQKNQINRWAGLVRREGITGAGTGSVETSELLDITGHSQVPAVVSLGTIIMSFVAKPLAGVKINGAPKFKEVQVYFYAFNTKAGCMSKYNIAQFPIYTKYFAREYSRYRLQTAGRAATVSVTDFMTFLHDKIVDDTMNPAYGISQLYKAGKEGPVVTGSADSFDRELRRIMTDQNIGHSPDFQMPMLTYDIESCPYVENNAETILKIHVVDRTNSSRSPLRELLTLSINDTLSSVSTFEATPVNQQSAIQNNEDNIRTSNSGRGDGRTPIQHEGELRTNWSECYAEVQQHAKNLGLIEDVTKFTIDNSGHRTDVTSTSAPNYRFVGGSDKLKSMVMEYTPHVIYGAMNTTIKQASLSTQANAALSTINMLRAGNADAILATGEQPGGVPMQIYPVQLSLTTLGCPFIRYSQELFVDFNTNTTADNLYYVTGIQHRISPGEFATTLKLTPCDAFPAYRNFIGQLNAGAGLLGAITGNATATATPTPATRHASHGRSGGRSPPNRPAIPAVASIPPTVQQAQPQSGVSVSNNLISQTPQQAADITEQRNNDFMANLRRRSDAAAERATNPDVE